jgi:uncharacterized protein (DUF362 family)
MTHPPKVILRRCDEYDVQALRAIISEGMAELGFAPRGRTLIKPNVVFAHPRYSQYAYTEPRFVEAGVYALRDAGAQNLEIGESGGMGVPGRMLFKTAGYYDMGRRAGVPVLDFNEQPWVRAPLSKGVVHKSFLAAKCLANADTKVWMPKLKYHITTTITQTLKLNIGILTHKERMIGHTEKLHEKIVDLLEGGYPDLIISDGITIGHGFESCARPHHLGLVLMSNHPLSSDVVAAHILGFDPHAVKHLVIAHERGYGSLELGDIDITGDITIPELQERTHGIFSDFSDLQRVDSPMKFYEGVAAGTDIVCDGGCATAVKGALGVIDAHTPGSLKTARAGAVVTGIYDGDVIHPGEPVFLIGDCTRVLGKIEASKVVRRKGCPSITRDILFLMPGLFSLPNPALDLNDGVRFAREFATRAAVRTLTRAKHSMSKTDSSPK